MDRKVHQSKKKVKIQFKHSGKGFDSETEAEIDKLTREEAQAMLKELSLENQELIERAEELNNQLSVIADRVEELKEEKMAIEKENLELQLKFNKLKQQ